MSIEVIKVVNGNGIIKEIQKKDLSQYIAMGWKEVNNNQQNYQRPKQFEKVI